MATGYFIQNKMLLPILQVIFIPSSINFSFVSTVWKQWPAKKANRNKNTYKQIKEKRRKNYICRQKFKKKYIQNAMFNKWLRISFDGSKKKYFIFIALSTNGLCDPRIALGQSKNPFQCAAMNIDVWLHARNREKINRMHSSKWSGYDFHNAIEIVWQWIDQKATVT